MTLHHSDNPARPPYNPLGLDTVEKAVDPRPLGLVRCERRTDVSGKPYDVVVPIPPRYRRMPTVPPLRAECIRQGLHCPVGQAGRRFCARCGAAVTDGGAER